MNEAQSTLEPITRANLAHLEIHPAINRLPDCPTNLLMDREGDDPHIRGQVFRSSTSLPVLFDLQQGIR